MRGVLTLLILVTLGGAAAADTERARLDAWDAYVLGESRDPRYAPVLLRQLRRYRDRDGAEASAVRLAILDALIRSDAKVTARDIHPLATRPSNEVIALLVRNPEPNLAVLSRMLENQRIDTRWALLCGVLARNKAPGFAARMLEELEVSLRITVVDGAGLGLGGGAGGAFGGRGCGRLTVPQGWPPRPRYLLTFRKSTGATLLVDGPKPVYLERKEYPPGKHGLGHRTERVRRNDLRLTYVAHLLGRDREGIGLRESNSTWIIWKDPEQVLREMKEAKSAVEREWDWLKVELSRGDLLTAEEAAELPLELRIQVFDSRRDRREALPHLPSGPRAVPQAR